MPEQYSIRGRSSTEIAGTVEEAIRAGRFAPGAKLPPIRSLAAELAVSPMTVASAYRDLRRRGLLTAAGRRGTRVSERPPLPVRTAPVVPANARDLVTGNPDPELLPSLTPAVRRLRPGKRLYGGAANAEGLVELARSEFARDGIAAPAIAVVGGALDGIERALVAHLRVGDAIAVEDPGFPRVFDLVRALGLEAAPVSVDDFGPRPEALERSLQRGVQAVLLTPRAQNPTGAALDARRARELCRVLDGHPDVLVLEDDHAALLAGVPALTVCAPERPHWVVVRSVSKALGPDLRVAVMTGDDTTIARVEGRQLLGTGWVSHVLQELVLDLWSCEGELVARAAQAYRDRRDALLSALAERGISAHGRSGLNVWVPVDEEVATATALLERGWAVDGGERYRIRSSPAIRITIATLRPEEAPRLAADVAAALAVGARTYSA